MEIILNSFFREKIINRENTFKNYVIFKLKEIELNFEKKY